MVHLMNQHYTHRTILKSHNMKYLIIIFLFISCSNWDTRLVLVNKTNKIIREHYQLMNLNDSIPDLTSCEKTNLYDVRANSEDILRTQNKWSLYLKGKSDKILRIFIINEDSLSKYGTCKVFEEQIFMKRFDLTYEDLEKLNWRVIYNEKQ